MIPIVSISNLIAFPFVAFISIVLFRSFLKTKERNVGYFFAGFLSLSLMDAILSVPGLVSRDALAISFFFAIFPFFAILGLGFWSAIPFSIMGRKNLQIAATSICALVAIIVTVINLNHVAPAHIYNLPPFIYWEDTRGAVMNNAIGAMVGVIIIYLFLFFLLNGFRDKNSYIKKRSLTIAAGLAVLLSASIVNFILGASYTPQKYIASIIAAVLSVFSSILIFVGVRYKKKTQDPYPPQKFSGGELPKVDDKFSS